MVSLKQRLERLEASTRQQGQAITRIELVGVHPRTGQQSEPVTIFDGATATHRPSANELAAAWQAADRGLLAQGMNGALVTHYSDGSIDSEVSQ